MGFFDKLFGREYDTTVTDYQAQSNAAERAQARPGAGFRFVAEDVFTITGRGTVLTGTVESGTVSVGQAVSIANPGGGMFQATVSGVEMFRKRTITAAAGDHVGLLLAGVSREQVAQGSVITAG